MSTSRIGGICADTYPLADSSIHYIAYPGLYVFEHLGKINLDLVPLADRQHIIRELYWLIRMSSIICVKN